jgi:hypothetical protein
MLDRLFACSQQPIGRGQTLALWIAIGACLLAAL